MGDIERDWVSSPSLVQEYTNGLFRAHVDVVVKAPNKAIITRHLCTYVTSENLEKLKTGESEELRSWARSVASLMGCELVGVEFDGWASY